MPREDNGQFGGKERAATGVSNECHWGDEASAHGVQKRVLAQGSGVSISGAVAKEQTGGSTASGDERKPDARVISGDIYDKAVPPTDAVHELRRSRLSVYHLLQCCYLLYGQTPPLAEQIGEQRTLDLSCSPLVFCLP